MKAWAFVDILVLPSLTAEVHTLFLEGQQLIIPVAEVDQVAPRVKNV